MKLVFSKNVYLKNKEEIEKIGKVYEIKNNENNVIFYGKVESEKILNELFEQKNLSELLEKNKQQTEICELARKILNYFNK